jgi:hypothetical protein
VCSRGEHSRSEAKRDDRQPRGALSRYTHLQISACSVRIRTHLEPGSPLHLIISQIRDDAQEAHLNADERAVC